MRTFVRVNDEDIPSDSKKIKFIDIEEDIYGRDLMTFEYQGKTCKSYVFSKNWIDFGANLSYIEHMKQTINVTPTWSNVLPLLILGIQDDNEAAKKELEKMAAVADMYVSAQKRIKNLEDMVVGE